MKRLVLSLTFVLALSVTGRSQVFVLSDDGTDRNGTGSGDVNVIVPGHFVEYDQESDYVPLGGGLMALTGMGIGYLLSKKRKED